MTAGFCTITWIARLTGPPSGASVLAATTLTALREVRQNDPAAVNWPSPLLAADWFVWHLFLSLSMLFAAPALSGPGLTRATRILMRSVAALCLLGLLGPLTGRLGLQSMGLVLSGASAHGSTFHSSGIGRAGVTGPRGDRNRLCVGNGRRPESRSVIYGSNVRLGPAMSTSNVVTGVPFTTAASPSCGTPQCRK